MSINNVGKSKANISQLKAGMEIKTVKQDPKMESVFNAIDKNGNGVLEENELKDFKENFDKNNDNVASKKEARKFIKENNLKEQNIKKKDVIKFLQEYGENTENVRETEVLEDGKVSITYNDGTKKVVAQDRSYDTIETKDDRTETKSYDSNDILQKEKIETEDKTTTNIYNKDGKTISQSREEDRKENTTTETEYNNQGEKVQSKITSGDDGSVATIKYDKNEPVSKEVVLGNNVTNYEYVEGKERITSKIQNKGNDTLEKKYDYKYNNDGSFTEEITQNGTQTHIINKCNSDGHRTEQTKNVGDKEYKATYDGQGNTTGIVIQNRENIQQIAKKFGCSVKDLQELNGKEKFAVGDTIKVPGEHDADMPELQNRKSSQEAKAEFQRDEQIRARKEAQRRAQLQEQQRLNKKFDQDLRKNYGLKNYSGKGSKITGKYKGGKTETFTVIGKAVYERTIVKDKKGNIHVIAKDGTILKGTYAMNTAKYQSSLLANGTRVAVVSKRKDNHNRYIALDANGKKIVVSHDGKVLKKDYIAASDDYDVNKKTQRTQTKGVGYGKAGNGKVYYFDDNNQGKAIIGQRRAEIVKKDTEFVTQQLYSSANYIFGTDEEGIQKGINNIYSREILQGVNANLKPYYSGNDQKMPVEDLILSEMSHTAARPLFKTLIDSDVMTTQEKAHTVKREIENEITGYTSTSDLNEVMQLCTDRDVRLEIEAQFKKDHPELAENEGSVVRSYIAGDGWNAQEVDQFDANWVKTGAYQEAKYVYQTDENGDPVLDANGNPVVILDKGDQAHRNGVIGRLAFDYQDKEALNKGLDAVNDNPNSFDYQYLDQRAGEEIAKDPQGKYQSRFTNQDNVQRYLAGFHSDETGNVDAGNLSASNTCLFKGVKPARVQAEEALYNAKNGDYSQTFDSMDSETYAAMAELVANGDVKGVKNMTDLYNKALKGAVTPNDKTKIKANAMISGQVNFTDEQIADFCVELMHSIDKNKGLGGSTGISASHTNDADYQTEQLKAILQNNPQIIDAVKARVQKENFAYTTTTQTMSGSGQKPTTTSITTNTKATYIQLLADTKTISKEEIFYDADGNKITDPQQIKQIKEANMASLNKMRQYVAELERDFKKGVDAEGRLSSWGNGILTHSGMGTDRDDVATQYRNAQLMLQQFEAAAQGRLRDSNGKVISVQDLAKQMRDKQNTLAKTNNDYKQSVTYAKMGIVLAPVIITTTFASGGAALLEWGTVGVAATGGVAAGATTYGVNALEYNTSYTGNNAEAREQNLEESILNGTTTAIGIGQMKYIGNMANDMGTVARTGIRLGTTVAADTGVAAAGEYATTGNISVQGTAVNMFGSVLGSGIGYKTLGKKQLSLSNMRPRDGVHVTKEAPVTGRNEVADAEVARNIDQSHLNGRDREMIAREMDAQGTPTQAELDAYAKEHAYQEPTAEERAILDAHQEQVRSDYSEAHRIENNATIKEQKAPTTPLSADEAAIKALEDEVGALDGQIIKLNKQLAGAKRANQMGRKNNATIEKLKSQIDALQQKRNAKAAELETARKPVEVKTDDTKSKTKANDETSVSNRVIEGEQKTDIKTENIINDVNSIDTSEIPSQHQKLWQDCKEKIQKLAQNLTMPNINSKELIARGKELLTSLKAIANSTTGAIKAKIENLYNDIRVMLNNAKKQIQNTHVDDLSAKQKEDVYTLRELYHSDLDDVATLRMDYPQYNYMSDKELLDFFKLDEKHAAFVKNRKDLFANGDAKYMERAYWNDSPYELTNNHSAWKMHLYSVDELDYQQMAEVVLPYLNKHKIAHKTLSSTMSPELLAKTAPEQTGKAFTIYPQSQEEMAQIAKDLDKLIREHNLTTNTSHITGDNQLGDSGRLFYRYEYNTGKLKDRIYTPEENSLMHAAYDSNRGEGQYLAHDMTPADDPWLNFDPSDPQSVPGQKTDVKTKDSNVISQENDSRIVDPDNNDVRTVDSDADDVIVVEDDVRTVDSDADDVIVIEDAEPATNIKQSSHFDGIDDNQLVESYNKVNKEWQKLRKDGDASTTMQSIKERREAFIKEIRQRGIEVKDDGFGNFVISEKPIHESFQDETFAKIEKMSPDTIEDFLKSNNAEKISNSIENGNGMISYTKGKTKYYIFFEDGKISAAMNTDNGLAHYVKYDTKGKKININSDKYLDIIDRIKAKRLASIPNPTPENVADYYPAPSSETVTFQSKRSGINQTVEVKTADDVYAYLKSFDICLDEAHIQQMMKLYNANPKRFNRIANSGLFDLINSGYIDRATYNSIFVDNVSINESTFFSNRFLNECKLAKSQLEQGIKPTLVKTIPENASKDYIRKNINIGDVYNKNGVLYVRSGIDEFNALKISKEKFDDLFPPAKSSAFQQGATGDCWLVSSIDNTLDYPKGRAAIFKRFEQVGDDIYVQLNGSEKVLFPKGLLFDPNGSAITGAKGVRMLEQAYMFDALKTNRRGFSPEQLAQLTNVEAQMTMLQGGLGNDGFNKLLGGNGLYIYGLENIEQAIKNGANNTNIMLGIGFKESGQKIPGIDEYLINETTHMYSLHEYAIKSYDPESNMCYLTNPWSASKIIEIPMDDILKHVDCLEQFNF